MDRVVWTGVESIESDIGEQEITARHSRLVCAHNHQKPGLVQPLVAAEAPVNSFRFNLC